MHNICFTKQIPRNYETETSYGGVFCDRKPYTVETFCSGNVLGNICGVKVLCICFARKHLVKKYF